MIKPLNNVSNVAFKGGLEDYQSQIKNKQEPKYNLILTPGSDYRPQPSIKRGFAGIFKGYNNISALVKGTATGIAKGIAFGGLAGVVAKNWKENTIRVANEKGRNIPRLSVKGFLGGTCSDIYTFVKNTFKAIPEFFSKTPKESLKTIKDLPKKYFEYLGKGKAVKGIAIGVAALTLGYNIIKSKIEANRKNADIDHSLNLRH